MAIHKIQAPDGSIHAIEAPDNATPEQITSFFQQNYKSIDKPEYQAGIGRTILDQSLQGATFGLGDEASDAIGTGLAKTYGFGQRAIGSLTGDESQKQAGQDLLDANLYDTARAQSKERLGAELSQRPALSIASNLAGGLLTGKAFGSTATGSNLANYVRSGGTAARALKGAASAGTAGAAYGFGAGEGTADDRLKTAERGAEYGAAIGGLLPVVGATIGAGLAGAKTVKQGILARGGEELSDTAKNLKSDAVAIKNSADLSSVKLAPNKVNELAKNIDTALADIEIIPEYTPKTIGVIKRIKERAEKGDLNLNQLDQYRRMLSNTAGEDSAAASSVRRAINDTLDTVQSPEDLANGSVESLNLLKQFKKDYTQASKFADVAEILKKADGNQNQIKSKLKTFLDNEENTRGWSDAEKLALRSAAKSNVPEKVLRGLGTFGFDIGKAKNIALPALTTGGAFLAPGVGGTLVGAGTVARTTGKYLARGKAEQLLKTIEQGGKVSEQQIMKLPPADAVIVLSKLKGLIPGRTTVANTYSNTNK